MPNVNPLTIVMDCCNDAELVPAHIEYGVWRNVIGRLESASNSIEVGKLVFAPSSGTRH